MAQSVIRGRSGVVVSGEFRRVLRRLPRRMQRKVLSGAAAGGAQVIRKEAIGNLENGDRRDVVTRKVRRPRTGAAASYVIGLSRERWFLQFKEFGVGPRVIRAPGREKRAKKARVLADPETGAVFGPVVRHPGQAARPFLRPAFDTAGEKAIRKVGERVAKGIEREAKKLIGPLRKSGLLRRR